LPPFGVVVVVAGAITSMSGTSARATSRLAIST
jgi:hypothetical protein